MTGKPQRDGLVEGAGRLIPVLRGQPNLSLALGQRHDRTRAIGRCVGQQRDRLNAEYPGLSHLVEAFVESGCDLLKIFRRMRRIQEQREPVLNVDAAVAKMIEKEAGERPIRMQAEIEEARISLRFRLESVPSKNLVQSSRENGGALRDMLL